MSGIMTEYLEDRDYVNEQFLKYSGVNIDIFEIKDSEIVDIIKAYFPCRRVKELIPFFREILERLNEISSEPDVLRD